eukprot:CAMPEP_0194268848 /NCGR_PEP_ID=MMETSP0169-20130528/3101_1 /TAXON_ID=218684 /ORGANISM="Corethron pennatum, Strain L29A3" /LENGTH=370 /DNA_ID=CAMNT_0039010253 /DNA_START=32 /DNA_END=1144 /DNA_ORIENTATION=-
MIRAAAAASRRGGTLDNLKAKTWQLGLTHILGVSIPVRSASSAAGGGKKKGLGGKNNGVATPPAGDAVTSWPSVWVDNEDDLQRDPEEIRFAEEERMFGSFAAMNLRSVRRRDASADGKTVPSASFDGGTLRAISAMDYLTSPPGSVEDAVGERRAYRGLTDSQRDYIERDLRDIVDRGRVEMDHLGDLDVVPDDVPVDPVIPPQTNWTEGIVSTDTVQKVTRGGSVMSFRALVVGGNLKGCAGFGTGKGDTPEKAVATASRMCKRNLFFVDRYKGCALVHDLVGKQNSCLVRIRAVSPGYGMRGSITTEHILYYFGITDACIKTHGNRNPYNVVRATFKAIKTHRSVSEICMTRGRRYITAERAKRLKV